MTQHCLSVIPLPVVYNIQNEHQSTSILISNLIMHHMAITTIKFTTKSIFFSFYNLIVDVKMVPVFNLLISGALDTC
jgi:hypothetical protein